jgi:hypothetical protein
MTDFAWPDDLVPYAVSFYLQPHTGGSESPFSRKTKVYGLSAPRWICAMSFRGGYWGEHGLEAVGPRLDAMIAKLKGRQNRAQIYDFRRVRPRARTWPLAASNLAALAGDTSMTITNLPAGTTVRAGDYIGGDGRPHIILDDVVANGSGQALVTFDPPLASNVGVGIATFSRVSGLFRLTDDDAGGNGTVVGEAVGITLEFAEDL